MRSMPIFFHGKVTGTGCISGTQVIGTLLPRWHVSHDRTCGKVTESCKIYKSSYKRFHICNDSTPNVTISDSGHGFCYAKMASEQIRVAAFHDFVSLFKRVDVPKLHLLKKQ